MAGEDGEALVWRLGGLRGVTGLLELERQGRKSWYPGKSYGRRVKANGKEGKRRKSSVRLRKTLVTSIHPLKAVGSETQQFVLSRR